MVAVGAKSLAEFSADKLANVKAAAAAALTEPQVQEGVCALRLAQGEIGG